MDRRTGRWIRGRAHLAQSVEILFATRTGSRIQRRPVGSELGDLQDRPTTERRVAAAAMPIAVALQAWEPRMRLTRVEILEATVAGKLALGLQYVERLRALAGDLTVTSDQATINAPITTRLAQ
ncbi:MAG: GPW/gp25 family protein [Hyphomicrobium sp.]